MDTDANVLRIYRYDHPEELAVLRRRAEPVAKVNRATRELLDDMLKTMYTARGVGLAAPQVGVSKRVIVVDVGDGPVELINPEITRVEGEARGTEGCLSIPDLLGEVQRAERVQVSGLNRQGRKVWVEGEGWFARALQHELDHLDGILFTDRALRVYEIPPEKQLRLVFMGTPEFSVTVLEHLVNEGFPIYAVVTQPDRPRGRGQQLRPTPVKVFARELGLEVLEPAKARDPAFLRRLQEFEPDVIVTCAYGKILPKEVLDLPKVACLNIHASLLPRYRGAAPIQRAIMDGATETGITIMYMAEGMDDGDILLQRSLAIEATDTAGTLHERLSLLAAEALPEALRLLATEETPPRQPQDHEAATYAPRLTTDEAELDWSRPAPEIVNRIRALDPRPGARTTWQGSTLKLYAARLAAADGGQAQPGEILAASAEAGLVIAAGSGAVAVDVVQPAGGRRLSMADFCNGYDIAPGQVLG